MVYSVFLCAVILGRRRADVRRPLEIPAKGHAMKLADIPPGSELAYHCAARQIAEQVEFELETCRRLFGTEPERVLELLANTPDWTVFFEDDE